MYKMLVLCLFVILIKPILVTMDTVESIVNISGYVGTTIELRCFNRSISANLCGETTDALWMYLFQDECAGNPTFVQFARCDQGSWNYLLNGRQLEGDDDACDNGLAYMRATEPGNFTYKCQEMYRDGTDSIQEVIFMISIQINSSISLCLAKHVPPSQNLTFDFICTHFHQRGCLTEDANMNELFIQRNGVRIIPDISLSNRIVARIGLENISSISQYYCVDENQSSPCVIDDVTLSNPVGITPIVYRVIEGGDAIFECILKDGHERGEKYEWSRSHHIELSRISGTASSVLKISDVKFEDDGVVERCIVYVNGISFYSEALLRIRTEGGSSTMASYSAEVTTNLLPLNAPQPFNLTTAGTSTQYTCPDSCKPILMYFLIPVFGVLLIAAVMVLAVYCWTKDIPGLPSADATYEVVQI